MKYLVLNCSELNTKDEDGDTPLHDAAYMGKLDVVKYLVELIKYKLIQRWEPDAVIP